MQKLTTRNDSLANAARLLLLLLVAAELYMCLQPVEGLLNVGNFDKLWHFCMHAANAILAALAFPTLRPYFAALALLFLLGPLIEILQSQIPGRDASWADQFANTLGLLAGIVCARLTPLRRDG